MCMRVIWAIIPSSHELSSAKRLEENNVLNALKFSKGEARMAWVRVNEMRPGSSCCSIEGADRQPKGTESASCERASARALFGQYQAQNNTSLSHSSSLFRRSSPKFHPPGG